jgi:membrane protein
MLSIFDKLDYFFKEQLWQISPDPSEKLKNILITLLRLLYKIGLEFVDGEIPRRASSLVYTTLLTIVPLLAVTFSVLKAFGVHNMLEPFMSEFLAPLGGKGDEITFNIILYVDNINVGLLGTVGLAALIYTVVNTIEQIELAFNYLWQIKEKRGFLERFRDYMSMILVGPVLIVSALGITTSIMSHSIARKITSLEPFGTALFLSGKLLPYILISLAFTLLFYILPYTKVNFKSALIGGVSSGIMWQAGSWAFARFIVSSTQYSAIYSGFAIVLLFMIWLYYNWLILLTGAKVSFYHQFYVLLHLRDDRALYNEWHTQRLSILLMYLIGYNYFYDKPRWTLPALVERLRIPKSVTQDIVESLEKSGLLLKIEHDRTFVPARDIETITLSDVVHSVRGDFKGAYLPLKDFSAIPDIEKIMGDMENAVDSTLSRETVKRLVASHMQDIEKTI